ncbi:transposase [Caldicellulosiruptor bescii]|uniref:transposase n=1 Tax=Caldicellulosiruptor bescii TaxID=31899 RepID=UPI000674B8EE|nr:transposase [Caldicellulosiruptor bescii]
MYGFDFSTNIIHSLKLWLQYFIHLLHLILQQTGKSLRKYFKKSRKLILKRYEKLKAQQREELEVMFLYAPKLRTAHRFERRI